MISKVTYRHINLLLAGVFLSVLVYSGIFSSNQVDYPLKCKLYELTGKPCPSCGLSRGMSECVRLNFKKANSYNYFALPFFIFIILQLIFRTILVLKKVEFNTKRVLRLDAFISLLLFVILFTSYISKWIHYFLLTINR